MSVREAEYRALKSYADIQDIEQWNQQRIEAGEPHPCEGCVEDCRGCKAQAVKHLYEPNQHVNKIFREILNQYARRHSL